MLICHTILYTKLTTSTSDEIVQEAKLSKKQNCQVEYMSRANIWYGIMYEALPGVLGIQGEGLFIFRDLGRIVIYFQGYGEKLGF